MKTVVCILVVAISCCFSTAAANCIETCASQCRQSNYNERASLLNAVKINGIPVINALINFLDAYDSSKTSSNIDELVNSIRDLKMVTGLRLESLLGGDTTVNDLAADKDRTLQYMLRAITDVLADVLASFDLGLLTTPSGRPVRPLVEKVSKYLDFLGLPSLDGRTTGIDGPKQFLAEIGSKNLGLLSNLLQQLLGRTSLTNEVFRGISSLIKPVTQTIGGLGSTLRGVTGGLARPSGGMTGTLGVGNILGDVAGAVPGVTRGVLNTVGGLTKGLNVGNALGSVTEVVPGLLTSVTDIVNGVANTAVNAVSGVLGGQSGQGGLLSGVLGLGGLLGGQDGKGSLLGGLVGQAGGVGDSLNSGMGATGLGGDISLTATGTAMLGGSTLGAGGGSQGAAGFNGNGFSGALGAGEGIFALPGTSGMTMAGGSTSQNEGTTRRFLIKK
ncbi:WAG22 antigen-like isoform X2 [Hyperolius riggenbachi]|uniref:WAG22 antigen-like isoform X2 n=1 Tax=Hyperolius riggenbachi TaxID=752182 RepID=UPI0035A2952B